MTFSRLLRALGALAFLALLCACGPDGPAIQEVSPGKGDANVAGDAPIKITFNHDMDRPTVEARFALQPAIEGCDKVTCPVTWTNRTMVLSHPQHQFASDTRYRVTLRPGYRDAAGRVEGLEHFWDFRSEAAPTIGTVQPGDGAANVAVDADITVQLSRAALVPSHTELTVVGGTDPLPISYRVAVARDDNRKLVVSPLALLRPKTTYTIHVGARVQDIHHNPLGIERDFHFTTGAADLSRSLAFLVRDDNTGLASRVAMLRPPASLTSPAPSLRLLYIGAKPVTAFEWSADAASMYVLESGTIFYVPLDGRSPSDLGITASAIAANPLHPELAYAGADGSLHLRAQADGVDHALPQAGGPVGALAWSGDGRRLAVVSDTAEGQALKVLDRETLSVTSVGLVSGPPAPHMLPPLPGATMAWNADGSVLAFVRILDASFPEVWTYRPLATQGSGLSRMGPLSTSSLTWSSDGGIVFGAGGTSASGPNLLQQALGQPLDGQAAGFSPVRGSKAGDTEPMAPPFDRRVAFVRPVGGAPQLWIMNNDGTGVAQMTFASYDPDDRLPAEGVKRLRWAPGAAAGG